MNNDEAKLKTRTKDIRTVQEMLTITGYFQEGIDGSLGPLTKNAFNNFRKDREIYPITMITPQAVNTLRDYFINEQVDLVKGVLLYSFKNLPDQEINKDIQNLQTCKADAAISLLEYKPCLSKFRLI